jgi:hypothetical protein
MCLPTVFSLTTVADRVLVEVLVLVAGMVPAPGESPPIGGRTPVTAMPYVCKHGATAG